MAATTLGLYVFLARGLGEAKVGVFAISQVFFYLFSLLTSFELSIYFGKEVALRRDNAASTRELMEENIATFLIGLGISVVSIIFLSLFYKQIDVSILLISSISGVIFGIEKNLSGFLLGMEKMRVEFIVQGISFVIIILPVSIGIKKLDIIGIYILRMAASIIAIFARWFFTEIRAYFRFRDFHFKIYNRKEVFYFAVMGLCFFVQYYFDLFILSFYVSKAHAGAYGVGSRIFSALCLLPEVTSFALIPYISRVYNKEETGDAAGFQGFYKKIMGSGVLLGILASALLFFSRNLVPRLFALKENPKLTADFVAFFSFLLFFRFVSYYTGTILSATRFQNARFYTMIAASIMMAALGFPLGYYFSSWGVLYAKAVMEIFIFTAYFILIKRSDASF
jgi:O-antigen/teichoic acid export membrane protein